MFSQHDHAAAAAAATYIPRKAHKCLSKEITVRFNEGSAFAFGGDDGYPESERFPPHVCCALATLCAIPS